LSEALAQVAQSVRTHGTLPDADAMAFVVGAGLEGDAALVELRRWGKLLAMVLDCNDGTVVESLKLRGVGEATARLAVSVVAGEVAAPAVAAGGAVRVAPITVSPETLNFGVLAPGQAAECQLLVSGGPGELVVEGAGSVTAEASRFGPAETAVRVTVAGRAAGAFVQGHVRLWNAVETVTVDVVAEWASQANLAELVANAAAGATLKLSGSYVLSEPLTITKSLTLQGSGYETCRITCAAGGHVVCFAGQGPWHVSGIGFEHTGDAPANVVKVEGGSVTLRECEFVGGKDGNGLALGGETTGEVKECVARDNSRCGIRVWQQAHPTLESNSCQRNESCGIVYCGTAAGMARTNECHENKLFGIQVTDQAHPTLEGNSCQRNEASGISYHGTAAGTARRNECRENKLFGISVADQAQPTLEGNRCEQNQSSGILYYGTAAGMARTNECHENKLFGIQVTDQAHPTLEGNSCQRNGGGEKHVSRQSTPVSGTLPTAATQLTPVECVVLGLFYLIFALVMSILSCNAWDHHKFAGVLQFTGLAWTLAIVASGCFERQTSPPLTKSFVSDGMLGGWFAFLLGACLVGCVVGVWEGGSAPATRLMVRSYARLLTGSGGGDGEQVARDAHVLWRLSGPDNMPQVLIAEGDCEYAVDNAKQHMISAFWMDQHDVTVGQYRAFCRKTGHDMPDQPVWNDTYPVVNVDWADATDYAEWVGRALPTLAQWEKAARGGLTGKIFPWGDDWDKSLANGPDSGIGHPTPVASYEPNGFGLYDMAGNVAGWCRDYGNGLDWTPTWRDPECLTPTDERVATGGSFEDGPVGLRCGARICLAPDVRRTDLGFRCAEPR